MIAPGRPVRAAGLPAGIWANAGFLFAAYAVPRGLLFLAALIAARALGPSEFGAYGTAAAFAVMLSVLSTAGMMPMLVRQVAQAGEGASAWVAAAHALKTASNTAMLAVLVGLGVLVLGYPQRLMEAALVLGLGYAAGSYAENLGGYFQGVERMRVWGEASAIFGLVAGGLGAVVVWVSRDLLWFCAAFLAGQLASLAWLFRWAPPAARWPRGDWQARARQLARRQVPFAAAALALAAYYKIDVVLLERWRGPAEAGIYAAAFKFTDIAMALSGVMAGAVFPRVARSLAQPREEQAGRLARAVVGLLFWAGAGSAALLWAYRGSVVEWLFGRSYLEASGVLAYLAPALPLVAISIAAGSLLTAAGRVRAVAWLYGLGLVGKLGLEAWLVPRSGAAGAALAMLSSETGLALAGGALLIGHLRRANASLPEPALPALPAGLKR
jgi:O-antigen/teichoic acid export membrane protein